MILTVSLNPAVDYVVFGDSFMVGETNRGEDIAPDPGGKGNNAARIAHALGAEVQATGMAGGFTGAFIEDSLRAEGIRPDFYRTSGATRITASFIDKESLRQTKIVPYGLTVSSTEIEGFCQHFDKLLRSGNHSMVSMNGSLARGMDAEGYLDLIKLCNERNLPVILDTSGPALAAVVSQPGNTVRPYMIKPNIQEARALCGVGDSVSVEEVVALLRPFLDSVPCIALTLGAEGAILLSKEESLRGFIPAVAAVNPICAGDAFIGGFLAAWDQRPGDVKNCFRWALAAGSATASVKGLMWERKLFDELLDRVEIRSLRRGA